MTLSSDAHKRGVSDSFKVWSLAIAVYNLVRKIGDDPRLPAAIGDLIVFADQWFDNPSSKSEAHSEEEWIKLKTQWEEVKTQIQGFSRKEYIKVMNNFHKSIAGMGDDLRNRVSVRDFPRLFLRRDQVAKQLGVSIDTVKRKIKSGEIPIYKFGRTTLISINDLHVYLNKQKKVQEGAKKRSVS